MPREVAKHVTALISVPTVNLHAVYTFSAQFMVLTAVKAIISVLFIAVATPTFPPDLSGEVELYCRWPRQTAANSGPDKVVRRSCS